MHAPANPKKPARATVSSIASCNETSTLSEYLDDINSSHAKSRTLRMFANVSSAHEVASAKASWVFLAILLMARPYITASTPMGGMMNRKTPALLM
jgi:hypothetical protein